MQFIDTAIAGAYLVELDQIADERGFFARAFCQREFESLGLTGDVVQSNLSRNNAKGTLRGMHYQIAPALETKLVRCTRGSVYDVIVDMRPDSPTYLAQVAITLSRDNALALFVPALCAHGFMTLEDDTDVLYMVSGFYTPECERGLRADDPALNIQWPLSVSHRSVKDTQWPLLNTHTD